MKTLVIVGLMLAVSSPLFAQEVVTSPENGSSVPGAGVHAHTVQIPEDDSFSYGVGLDTVVYNGYNPLLEEVRIDTRYYVNSGETTVMAVAKIDPYSYFKKRT